MIGLDANGLQSKDSFRTKPESVTGEEVLARHFPPAPATRSRWSAGPRPPTSSGPRSRGPTG